MAAALQPIHVRHPRRKLERGARLLRRILQPQPRPDAPRDVWHYARPKYRVRAVLLLLLNAALFAGLGCFTFWLRTGDYSPFTGSRAYWPLLWEAFDPASPRQVTLIDFLLYPIPADQVPLMMVIVPTVLATLTAIPILVAMLYRFPFALIFTAILGFVAVYPWLALNVTLCCWLACRRRLQFSFRLATALISLLPVVAYYALATRNVTLSAHLTPLELGRLYVPWVLALAGACVLMALVLLIARLVNYRPGAIVPLMSVMFAVPVVLFETKVGRDELYYRLLHAAYAHSSKNHFPDEFDAGALLDAAVDRRLDEQGGRGDAQAIREQLLSELTAADGGEPRAPGLVGTLIHEQFAAQQDEAMRACERFRARFPRSRYVPNALYLQGQTLDTRVEPHLGLFRGAVLVRYYQDFPNAASGAAWQELCEREPDSPLASVAALRLASLAARAGNVDRAINLLKDLITRFADAGRAAPATQASGLSGVLARRPAVSALGVDLPAVVLEGRKLLTLLQQNRDPAQHDRPLRALLSMDPHHSMYGRNLQRLLEQVSAGGTPTPLRDDLQVLLAKSQPSRSFKIERLKRCIEQLTHEADSDALPRARFELGLAYQEDNRPEEARTVLEELQRYHPDSPWAAEAGRKLAAMGAAVKTP